VFTKEKKREEGKRLRVDRFESNIVNKGMSAAGQTMYVYIGRDIYLFFI